MCELTAMETVLCRWQRRSRMDRWTICRCDIHASSRRWCQYQQIRITNSHWRRHGRTMGAL